MSKDDLESRKSAKVSDSSKAEDLSTEAERKKHYFDNYAVESLLIEYVQGGCVEIDLRDRIMSHASELIRNIIRTHNFHNLYGRDEAAAGDLFQVAWQQIESTLYKFDWQPGHTKIFNMWSQVAKTVMQAYIKKDSRDRKNFGSYKDFTVSRRRPHSEAFARFAQEASEVCTYNDDHKSVLLALGRLYEIDDRPHDGLIGKLSDIAKTELTFDVLLSRRKTQLGMTTEPIDEPERLGVDGGLFVTEICNDSPIAESGIQIKDIMISFGGRLVGSQKDVSVALRQFKTGDEVEVTILRALPRQKVIDFLKFIRLRSYDFTDSPANERPTKGMIAGDDGEDDYEDD